MEGNIIKNLTYISKINKNKKEINYLFQVLMRNLNISFNEEKSEINYEEYYFNGIHLIILILLIWIKIKLNLKLR